MAHRSEFVSVRGVRTHLLHGGRGEPLLVLHPEYAANLWPPYLDRLAMHFRVLAPDHLGFGDSERPDWLDGIDDLVLHYADLLDAMEIPRCAVLGSSLGGWIAAALAMTYPARVTRLVLVGAAGLKVDGVPRYDVFLNQVEDTLRHLFHDESRAAQLLPTEYGPEVLVRGYREATTLARLAWNPYLYDPKLERRLARITAPTLVVWGEQDTFLPPAYGEAYARAIPGATLRTVAECGHLVAFEQTAAFIELTTEFLLRP
ncbi:MAG: alpha/beta hydrolase [Deltaproteobacteria bacterium]|nr:alpha/beta hydrolase [Deltaproteobacteria bacterium]MBI3390203.1 alpha/beta hydrolase [Deltaproteobacteria bacterium]